MKWITVVFGLCTGSRSAWLARIPGSVPFRFPQCALQQHEILWSNSPNSFPFDQRASKRNKCLIPFFAVLTVHVRQTLQWLVATCVAQNRVCHIKAPFIAFAGETFGGKHSKSEQGHWVWWPPFSFFVLSGPHSLSYSSACSKEVCKHSQGIPSGRRGFFLFCGWKRQVNLLGGITWDIAAFYGFLHNAIRGKSG